MGDGKASTLFAEFSRKCLLSNIERICTVHRDGHNSFLRPFWKASFFEEYLPADTLFLFF